MYTGTYEIKPTHTKELDDGRLFEVFTSRQGPPGWRTRSTSCYRYQKGKPLDTAGDDPRLKHGVYRQQRCQCCAAQVTGRSECVSYAGPMGCRSLRALSLSSYPRWRFTGRFVWSQTNLCYRYRSFCRGIHRLRNLAKHLAVDCDPCAARGRKRLVDPWQPLYHPRDLSRRTAWTSYRHVVQFLSHHYRSGTAARRLAGAVCHVALDLLYQYSPGGNSAGRPVLARSREPQCQR